MQSTSSSSQLVVATDAQSTALLQQAQGVLALSLVFGLSLGLHFVLNLRLVLQAYAHREQCMLCCWLAEAVL